MKGKLEQLQEQQQRLLLSPKMKQSLHFLKLPIMELSSVIRAELEQNPLLEADEPEEYLDEMFLASSSPSYPKGEEAGSYIENCYAEEQSLFSYLSSQAKEHFTLKNELDMAYELLGHLDEKGFFTGDLEEISLLFSWSKEELLSILTKIQYFDPPGIGARNIQELLLRQLENKQAEKSLAYTMIHSHFDALLHNRISVIAKALECDTSKVYQIIKEEIAPLDLVPCRDWQQTHYKESPLTITADVSIDVTESAIVIDVNEEKIPHLRINEHYLQLLHKEATEENRKYLQEKLLSGKSLLKNIYERNQTLYRIAEEIATYQSDYFINPHASLLPMTMKELGRRLDLHESTIARAASGKYMNTPRGLVAMRTFFTHGYEKQSGEMISSSSIKEEVKQIIQNENPKSPYSDEKIAELIQEKGVTCARRTIAKYRQELGLGNRGQRKRV